jgi:hypothetical protein
LTVGVATALGVVYADGFALGVVYADGFALGVASSA